MSITIDLSQFSSRKAASSDAVSKELTLSEELIAELPRSVRLWKTDQILKWLGEIFVGAADLPR
jgi:hypothetical protein